MSFRQRSANERMVNVTMNLWDTDDPEHTAWVVKFIRWNGGPWAGKPRMATTVLRGNATTRARDGDLIMPITLLPREAKKVIREQFPLVVIMLNGE